MPTLPIPPGSSRISTTTISTRSSATSPRPPGSPRCPSCAACVPCRSSSSSDARHRQIRRHSFRFPRPIRELPLPPRLPLSTWSRFAGFARLSELVRALDAWAPPRDGPWSRQRRRGGLDRLRFRRSPSSRAGGCWDACCSLGYRAVLQWERSLFMCGIAGILMRHGPADEAALRRMAVALAHRGPDDVGIHLAGSLGLTNTRLSIIDVRGGHQPMVDERLALVANGEIYNFVELRPALEARGRRFQTGSDSEIILHAYALDGLPALASLHGMFAFALYDLATRELVLARDRLGIKPLYYAELPDRLLFASELKALLAVWPREPELEPRALVEFLQHRFNTGETGLVHGIRRLAPGTALVVDTALHLREHRYWSPLELRPRRIRLEEAVEEFEPLIRRVMIEHLRADVPYGLFLSSGVDSGSLLALITELSGRPVRTFSIGYGDVRASDELGPAASVARRFGAKHTEVILDRKAVFRRLPYTMWSTDDLLHDYASLPTSFLAERAAG